MMARKKKQLKAVRAAEARKKRRNRKKKRAIILALEIIILLLLLSTAYVMAKYDMFQTVEISADDLSINDGAEKEGYTTVALFATDSRSGEVEAGTRTDTIIVVSIDNKTKEINMASVYRDTVLRYEGGTYNKANGAYAVGGP
ncbi:MAG: LCP family protein, partial [Dorea sp.]